ncbi:hypothetical protein A5320_07530 [Rheinheimera sp. SA_1]|uniref:DUF2897 family protein n=1 Tax=Rheinheimera sp. SA_1 TaxID=1827365 RepID=UPI0007FE2046|nr:DUF2897 family protein [Rheinheimera sp. SA_1]OBP15222.1 hypothetical protein A5320_07530 [Rheinheimera sp. SA_1]
MSLTFILILLLVIGIVFANIALLRFGSKPMPVKDKKPHTASDTAAPGKTQAATTSAMPLTTTPTEPGKNTIESNKTSPADSNDSGSGGD